MDKQPEFLSPAQLVARWNHAVTTGTLANWRNKSTAKKPLGPPYIKFGSRVRYPLDQVMAWEAQHLVGGTTNTPKD